MHEVYMRRALELAKRGWGMTNPNPLVGAVVVKGRKIVGEGYHPYLGGPHAEVVALNEAGERSRNAELYVTLEPCCHYGRTPPCMNKIIESGIKKVYVAMKDPNPKVSGKGIEILKNNGIEVEIGILEKEARKLNEIFIKYITTKLPFVIMKSAMSLDGKIATFLGDSKWITSEESRRLVHKLRQRVSAVLVGVNTVIKDNPRLNVRLSDMKDVKNPYRIVVDSFLRIPLTSQIVKYNDGKTIVATTEYADDYKKMELEKKGIKLLITNSENGRVSLKDLMKKLGEMEMDSVLIEGGSEINASAIEQNIVDKVIFFIAPKIIGGRTAKSPIGGRGMPFVDMSYHLKEVTVNRIGPDIMIEGYLSEGRWC